MQYEIKGGSMPVVVCTLQNGESIKTEKGAMSWMSPNMEMQTNAGGGIGKAFSRIFTGESMFQKDRKSTRLNSSHLEQSRMPSSA